MRKNWMVRGGKLRRHRPRKDAKGNLTVLALKKDVWQVFSRYIRRRDCLRQGGFAVGRCCTCGRIYPFEKLQAGHFVDGRNNSILFDERGVHAQCHGCNMFKGGAKLEYHDYMMRNYGANVIEELRRKSHIAVPFTVPRLNFQLLLWLNALATLDPGDVLVAKYRKKGIIL